MPVKKGDKVKVEYEGTLNDGTVFDSTEKHGEPIEFEVGSGQLIPGFEDAVEGMEKGEEKMVTIEPKEAYGDSNPKLIKTIPKENLPRNDELQAGMVLMLNLADGMQFTAQVQEVTEETITIDLNHPLAGKTLNFKIKILDVAS